MNPLSSHVTRNQQNAARAWVGFVVVYLVVVAVVGIGLSVKNHTGSGIGDGRQVHSCYTPGGPYYVKGVPQELQRCPNPTTSQLKQPGMGQVGVSERILRDLADD
jgi:hypothetical protein